MTADLAAWDRSLLNIMTGQSGHVFSRNYKDQWRHYYAGESFPMTFVEVRPKAVLELVPGG